jgi:phosphoribosylanthranilate isomerase
LSASPRVKICGVKRLADASEAVRAGADAIGLLVGQRHPSGDFISPEDALCIVSRLPPFIVGVMVTHVVECDVVAALVHAVGVSVVQIHSEMTAASVAALRRKLPHASLIKALHVTASFDFDSALAYVENVDAFVLDTCNPRTGQVGGTGRTHDWTVSRAFVEWSPKPVVLAGGLTPENVSEAIKTVQPYAVDVNSGVKGGDGWKDPARMRRFVRAARLLFG